MEKKFLKVLAVLFLILGSIGISRAQAPIVSAPQSITLQLQGAESYSLICTPTLVTFASAPGTTVPGSVPISCVSTWNLSSTRTSVTLYSGFATAASGLVNGANLIPSSAVAVTYGTGTAQPCSATLTQTGTGIGAGAACGTAGSGNLLSTNFSSTATTALALSIAEPATLPAGAFSGTLLIYGVVL